MFIFLREMFVFLYVGGTNTERREAEANLAHAKTLAELENRQRDLDRGGTDTHLTSGW